VLCLRRKSVQVSFQSRRRGIEIKSVFTKKPPPAGVGFFVLKIVKI